MVELNCKSSGRVGWWSKTGRDLFVDTEDLLRLALVPGAVTVFVKNNAASRGATGLTANRAAPHLWPTRTQALRGCRSRSGHFAVRPG